jgi:hypothetical protein
LGNPAYLLPAGVRPAQRRIVVTRAPRLPRLPAEPCREGGPPLSDTNLRRAFSSQYQGGGERHHNTAEADKHGGGDCGKHAGNVADSILRKLNYVGRLAGHIPARRTVGAGVLLEQEIAKGRGITPNRPVSCAT